MIKSNNRISVFGKTDSGKTVLVKRILWGQYQNRVFYDPKCMNHDLLSNASLVRTPDALDRVLDKKKSILYQPDDLEMEDFDEVCKILFRRGNIALFCDEVSGVCSASSISKWHKRLLVQGREKGLGVVSCSQRPRDCHSNIVSESEHFFVFRLNLETDVKKISMMIPRWAAREIYALPAYHFMYFNTSGVVKFFEPVRF